MLHLFALSEMVLNDLLGLRSLAGPFFPRLVKI